jgi:hypothetical protein
MRPHFCTSSPTIDRSGDEAQAKIVGTLITFKGSAVIIVLSNIIGGVSAALSTF